MLHGLVHWLALPTAVVIMSIIFYRSQTAMHAIAQQRSDIFSPYTISTLFSSFVIKDYFQNTVHQWTHLIF